jgi:hypothetical protein
MAEPIYVLCALLSAVCALLLFRQYLSARTPLTLWSGICFVGLAVNNALLVIDLVIFPRLDLSLLRTAVALAAVTVLVAGFVWDAR